MFHYWLIIVAAIFSGLIAPGGRIFSDLGFSLFEIVFYRALIGGVPLLPIILFRKTYRVIFRRLPLFILYGVIAAFTTMNEFASVVLGAPVAVAVLLLYLQPVWTTILGKVILGEIITRRKIVALVVTLIGVMMLLQPWNIEVAGPPIGIAAAILGGIGLSLWVIFGRLFARDNIDEMTIAFSESLFSSIWLLFALAILARTIDDTTLLRLGASFPLHLWGLLLLFILFSNTVPMLTLFKGMQRVNASVAGVILLLEPISAALIAWVLLHEAIGVNALLGGTFILSANYIVRDEMGHG